MTAEASAPCRTSVAGSSASATTRQPASASAAAAFGWSRWVEKMTGSSGILQGGRAAGAGLAVVADEPFPIAFGALQVGAHQRLRQVAVAAQQRVEDLQVLGVRLAAALRVGEVDRQPGFAHHVVDAAQLVEHGVLGGAHDLQMKGAILLGDLQAGLDLARRFGEDLAQPSVVVVGGTAAGELGSLDLVDLADLDDLVDAQRVERQACLGKQCEGLDASLAGRQVDARFGAPLDDAHGLEDGQGFADLATADGKMLRQLALGRRPACLGIGKGEQVGGKLSEEVLFRHRSLTAWASRKSSATLSPSPGRSGSSIIPSFTATVSSIRSCSIGLAPSEYSMMNDEGTAAQTCSPAKKAGAPAHICGASLRLKADASVAIAIASLMPPQKPRSGWKMSAAPSSARS